MRVKSFTRQYFDQVKSAIDLLNQAELEKLVEVVWTAYTNNKNIFFAGNGGSASTASHMAADIGKNIGLPIKAFALTDNVAWMTALGNDLSYEDIFVEQMKNFANPNDLLVVISGSGNSANVVKTVQWANQNKMKTVGLLGFDGGKLAKMVNHRVLVPVNHYGIVEGVHSEIQHFLVESLKLKKNEG
jgi:D-sedoheptulose 7-phosphate isomerase